MSGPVLALDTSVRAAGAALLSSDGALLGRWGQDASSSGTAALAPGVAALLDEAGVGARDLGGVAVGVGPGSYTGLRAGIAFARALVHVTGVALVGVPSTAAAALAVLDADPTRRSVVVLVDARRGEHYRADYARGTGDALLVTWGAPRLVADADATSLAVDGSDHAHDEASVSIVREPVADPYDVGRLGRSRLASGGDDPSAVLPLYLKRSHAEIALEQRAR